MSKPRVRPPRTPRGESLKTTILNQDKQIKLLTERVVELATARDQETRRASELNNERDQFRRRLSGAEQMIESLNTALRSMNADMGRLLGYQERVREEDKHRYGDLPAS